MKKIIQFIIIVCMAAIMLGGCSGKAQIKETTVPSETDGIAQTVEDVPLLESMIYNANGIKITVSSRKLDCTDCVVLDFAVKNQTDHTVHLSLSSMIINNVSVPAFESIDSSANTTEIYSVTFSSDELAEYSIERICRIGTKNAIITDSVNFLEILTFDVAIEDSQGYVQKEDDSGTQILNENGIKIVYKESYQAKFGDYQFVLYIRNDSGMDLDFTCVDTSVNGVKMTGFMHEFVADGTWTVCNLSFYVFDVKDAGIDTIESVEARFEVRNRGELILDSAPVIVYQKEMLPR